MIAFFDAMNDESSERTEDDNPEVDEESIVGTSWMLHFHQSDSSSSDDSSSDTESGDLELLSQSDAERVEQEEALQNAREAHVIKRSLQSVDTGIAVPIALIPTWSSDSDSDTESQRAEIRRQNANRKRK